MSVSFAKAAVVYGKGHSTMPEVRKLLSVFVAADLQQTCADDSLTPFDMSYLQGMSSDLRSWWADIVGSAKSPSEAMMRLQRLELHCSTLDRWSSGADLLLEAGVRKKYGVLHYSAETLITALYSSPSLARDGLQTLRRSAQLLLGRSAASSLCVPCLVSLLCVRQLC